MGQPLVPQTLRKIEKISEIIRKMKLDIKISVDGNVNIENIPSMVSNGGDTLISGSSGMFFKDRPLKESIKIFRDAINRGLDERT